MTQRRSLVEGLSDTPEIREREKNFVYGNDEPNLKPFEPNQEQQPAKRYDEVMPQFKGRVPLTTRCRPELASAIKRASLERQLQGIEPSRIQDIIEHAVEQWLREHTLK